MLVMRKALGGGVMSRVCVASVVESTTAVQLNSSATVGKTPHDKPELQERPIFKPKKVLILSKLSRLEFERHTHPFLDEEELKRALLRRGSDYMRLRERHDEHQKFLKVVEDDLKSFGIETRTVQRFGYNESAISWADAIFSAGGDGTFLLAASRILSQDKPVIGINTDPEGSEGYLCLLKKEPHEHFKSALQRLWDGDFRCILDFLRNVKSLISSVENIYTNVSQMGGVSHQECISPPSLAFRQNFHNLGLDSYNFVSTVTGADMQKFSSTQAFQMQRIHIRLEGNVSQAEQVDIYEEQLRGRGVRKRTVKRKQKPSVDEKNIIIPSLALNDVFIGETLSSRVSYYEIQCNGGESVKQKSSGVLICTGSGSTSWYFNINKITKYCISELLKIVAERTSCNINMANEDLVNSICDDYNSRLIFAANVPRWLSRCLIVSSSYVHEKPYQFAEMAYCVRNPIYNATFREFPARGMASQIRIRSRCYDAHLVIDGRVAYNFNDGAEAIFEVEI